MTAVVRPVGHRRGHTTAAWEGLEGPANLEDRDDPETGSATVVAVGVIAGLLSLVVAALVFAGVLVATHRARAAADLAALAGAGVLVSGDAEASTTGRSPIVPGGSSADGDACRRAGAVAETNGASMTHCVVEGAELLVETSVPLPVAASALGPARGVARAGPPRMTASDRTTSPR